MDIVNVFFAEGFEEIEALTVVDLLRRAMIETQMVSVTGDLFVTGGHDITIKTDLLMNEVNFKEGTMIILPGGMPGTINLEKSEMLMTEIKHYHLRGKLIGAICAAPSILGHLDILEGHRACCYPSWENHLNKAQVSMDGVVVSNHIITARGVGFAVDFSLAIVEKLKGKEKAEQLAEAIVYQKL